MASPEFTLDEIAEQISNCRKCELCDGRTHVVPGSGSPDSRVMIIGEAPGRNEDIQGRPFVGAAGRYLDELLGLAGLSREEVFIANVLKCRPPGNRDPRPEEIQMCADYLRGQTKAIDPEFIVTLGNFSTKFILRTEVGITKLRGRLHKAGRFKVFPVLHPAAALYNPKNRPILEDDFAKLGELLKGEGGQSG